MWQFKDSWQGRDGKKRGLCSFPRRTHGKCGLRLTRVGGFVFTPFLLGSSLLFSLHRPPVPISKEVKSQLFKASARRVGLLSWQASKINLSIAISRWTIPHTTRLQDPTPFFYLLTLNSKWTPWMRGKKQIVLRHGSTRLSHTQTTLLVIWYKPDCVDQKTAQAGSRIATRVWRQQTESSWGSSRHQ